MALPASPPISLLQVCAEFGAPAGTPLSAFVRGGAWVPNTGPNAGVPTSLPISLLNLLGATAGSPVSASPNPTTQDLFLSEPAPMTQPVSTGFTVSGAGVTSITSVVLIAGSAADAVTGSGLIRSFDATLNKNTSRTGTYRVTVNTGAFVDVIYELSYSTDL